MLNLHDRASLCYPCALWAPGYVSHVRITSQQLPVVQRALGAKIESI